MPPMPAKLKKSFEELVKETNSIKNCFQPGIQALSKNERNLISINSGEFCGSVDLDGCLSKQGIATRHNRWDYLICHEGKIYCVEIHGAKTSQVSKLVDKAQALKDWLNSADGLEISKRVDKRFPPIWVPTKGGNVDIREGGIKLAGSKLTFALAKKGLLLKNRLVFPLIPKVV